MSKEGNEKFKPRTLVVYYSKTGNTRKVAQDIAQKLEADLEEITDMKSRKGVLGFIMGGRDAMTKKGTRISVTSKDPAEYDLVILGSPIWANNIAPALRTYLNKKGEKIATRAFFVTAGGGPSSKVLQNISEISTKEPLAILGLPQKELAQQEIYEQKMNTFIEKIKK